MPLTTLVASLNSAWTVPSTRAVQVLPPVMVSVAHLNGMTALPRTLWFFGFVVVPYHLPVSLRPVWTLSLSGACFTLPALKGTVQPAEMLMFSEMPRGVGQLRLRVTKLNAAAPDTNGPRFTVPTTVPALQGVVKLMSA